MSTEVPKADTVSMEVKADSSKDANAVKTAAEVNACPTVGCIKAFNQPCADGKEDSKGDVYMEATITTDDVIRAGGLGATDDISNFLPVAVDSTDFEASLRHARDFEEPQEEISRPGLGWKG
ncbi:hypothetical protein ACLOJK_000385 [Asimina triloba]